jgi:adenylosuccinate lyase
MPRELYASIAQALCQIVLTLDKIATSIRLGARSGRPIFQEPFGKKQKGSSAMPHKKNTIATEQIEGMGRLAIAAQIAITLNIRTWEERAIEQSCVERVAWPDIFHVLIHSLKTMTRVLQGLVVYPDNMLLEIIESRGTYASDEAKEFLKKLGEPFGLTVEECYRIVQLAAFNAFAALNAIEEMRANLPKSLREADEALARFEVIMRLKPPPESIQHIIRNGDLHISNQLDVNLEEVQRWNEILKKIFAVQSSIEAWDQIFLPSYLLKNEATLYEKILPPEEKKENVS